MPHVATFHSAQAEQRQVACQAEEEPTTRDVYVNKTKSTTGTGNASGQEGITRKALS
jgi:hypothetical protein